MRRYLRSWNDLLLRVAKFSVVIILNISNPWVFLVG